jgi:hypothetical protein
MANAQDAVMEGPINNEFFPVNLCDLLQLDRQLPIMRLMLLMTKLGVSKRYILQAICKVLDFHGIPARVHHTRVEGTPNRFQLSLRVYNAPVIVDGPNDVYIHLQEFVEAIDEYSETEFMPQEYTFLRFDGLTLDLPVVGAQAESDDEFEQDQVVPGGAPQHAVPPTPPSSDYD